MANLLSKIIAIAAALSLQFTVSAFAGQITVINNQSTSTHHYGGYAPLSGTANQVYGMDTSGINVEMKTISTAGKLSVSNTAGSMALTGGYQAVIAKSTSFTAVVGNAYQCTGSIAVTLPTAVGVAGQEILIENAGSGTLTFDTTGSQTISGSASGSRTNATQYKVNIEVSDGANWIQYSATP